MPDCKRGLAFRYGGQWRKDSRLCRSGGEFSVVKCYFTEENIHHPFSKKRLQHFFDTLYGASAPFSFVFHHLLLYNSRRKRYNIICMRMPRQG